MYDAIKAIEERRSVRTYDGRALADSDRQALQQYIGTLSNPFGADAIRISFVNRATEASGEKLGTYGFIKGAQTFMALAVDRDPQTWVAAGYEFEDLVLYATSLGLGTVWLGGTFKRSTFAKAITLPDDMMLPAVSPVGYAAAQRLTERIMRSVARADKRKPWSAMFFDGTPDKAMTEEAAAPYAKALEMLRLGPSATNAQPWRVVRADNRWEFFVDYKSNISESERVMKHLDIGIAICHFDLTRKQLGLSGKWFQDNPSLNVPDTWHYIATYAQE